MMYWSRLHHNATLRESLGFASFSVDLEGVIPGRKVHFSSTESVLKRSFLADRQRRRVMEAHSLGVDFRATL